ncbi:MAG TPA: hypothetical protein VKV40_18065 [Ktedonobacteraceae bacterium]|nr:hypothetical protein [Ktedonobacteraceae bacterium]
MFETSGLLVYSFDTQLAATDIAVAISPSFALVITGLVLLAIEPV